MTVFKVAMIILVALCIIGEIAIGWSISYIMDDVGDMKGIYKDLIRDEIKTTGECIDKWREAIDNWSETFALLKALDELKEET